MSRPLLIIVVVIVLLLGGLIALGSTRHEVPQTQIEKPVAAPGGPNAPQG